MVRRRSDKIRCAISVDVTQFARDPAKLIVRGFSIEFPDNFYLLYKGMRKVFRRRQESSEPGVALEAGKVIILG